MSTPESDQPAPRPPRKKKRLWLVLLLVLLAAAWFGHPAALTWGLGKVLDRVASDAGFRLQVGKIDARLSRPFVFENVRLRAQQADVSRTAADVERLEIAWNWPWQMIGGPERMIRSVRLEGVRGVFDFRTEALLPSAPLPALTDDEERSQAAWTLRFLPQQMALQRANLEFLADDQSYFLLDASLTLDERQLGTFTAEGAEIAAGTVRQALGTLQGVTAWKQGTVYLADLTLRDGLRLDNFRAELARPGGLALGLEAEVFSGRLRADLTYFTEKNLPAMDAAVWAAGIQLAPLAELLAIKGQTEGLLREGRMTFRGVPEDALDAQVALRLEGEGFRWNGRGWDSLELGANLNNRRLSVGDFELRQKDNRLTASGEVSLADGWAGLANAPFQLNLSASIKELGALAGLIGPPFHEMTGRTSLSGSISGKAAGQWGGYLSLEASDVGFRQQRIDSAHVELLFRGGEAEMALCEIWSGKDYLLAKATAGLTAPHNYTGEVQARIEDLAAYTSLLPAEPSEEGLPQHELISSGALQLRWQGDGTISAHSGAFTASLENLISEFTPAGLTARFAGTYSPENVYFSGLELDQGNLRFSTRATLAKSGVFLQDAVLKSGNRELADAEVFLPLDPFAMLTGKPPAEAIHFDQPAYVSLASRGALALRDLLRLTGQDLPVEGTLRASLKAHGPPTALTLDGTLEGRDLLMRLEDGPTPSSNLNLALSGTSGQVALQGSLSTKGFPALTLAASAPFGLAREDDGSLRWTNPDGQLSARVDIPKTDLAFLRPFLPNLHRLAGTLTGGLTVEGTVGRPVVDGRLQLENGAVMATPRTPGLGHVNAAIRFNASEAAIEKFTGEVGAGPFEISGRASLTEPGNPKYDFTLTGKKLLLHRDAALRLRANIDLKAAGDNNGGALTGSIRLTDSRIYRRLEITPLLVPSPLDDQDIYTPPQLAGLVPAPFAAWTVDVSLSNEDPFTVVGNIASGEIKPDLRLTKTLGDPLLLGRVELINTRAFLPFATMTISNGIISFVEDNPWMPILDVRGTAQSLDYTVEAFAFGPLTERHLILRSDPPLPQESLILLLTTGIAPGVYTGAGFGEAAIGQGGMLLLRAFARQFEPQGVDVDSLINRLQITALPPQYQGGRATLRGRFRLWEGLSLMSERDEIGFYNAGVTYSLRFR